MCNRYSSTKNEARVALKFTSIELPLSPRYNIAPTNHVPIVTLNECGRLESQAARWGFTGYNGHAVTNARSETARFQPMFRNAWAQRRCIIPADGFYEWKTESRRKHPHRFVRHDETIFWFAGLWTEDVRLRTKSSGPASDDVENAFVILTKEANADVAAVHDRMPVILAEPEIEMWLSPETSREWIPEGIRRGDLRSYRVGPFVSTAGLETPDCVAPLTGLVQAEFLL